MEAGQGENSEHWLEELVVATRLFCDTGLGCDLLCVVHFCVMYLSNGPWKDWDFR